MSEERSNFMSKRSILDDETLPFHRGRKIELIKAEFFLTNKLKRN